MEKIKYLIIALLISISSFAQDSNQYIIKFKLKQSRFSLNIMSHIKDHVNAIEFEFPTDKKTYNSLSVGDKIVDDFRVGSFIFNSTFSDWQITIVDKRIIYNK
ncbi:MAG: hypothetical protein KGV59_06300 [Tenacibaculum sp.]|nr:hypothetical protein [Tenacibaculum sp.]